MQTDKRRGYEDIIDLPHHISATRRHMAPIDRAAQFSSFAALSGHDAVIRETARVTCARKELDENEQEILNRKLQQALRQDEPPMLTITYFVPDKRKPGGAYVQITGKIRRVDEIARTVILTDKTTIPLDEIAAIEGEGEWREVLSE